ncbi:non-ribosomal peptide synthetase [Dactylosporangium matsuzakiense]|uniref:Amino acid adenylation protein n=1 Tax=Dactylosporangium matsuzakiense TaxID=53360 RepID=A0A9W6NQJ6_9ACTN|nr:amino acid adenylation domain-containing protein [Dactylosporangium matsuzakiense]UWZ42306.1 amino acid adenylation domain-containing protein [Dactylosporangium matsuzakiense]GLL05321.1 amino acid adenylation protein [Dactylosporangium matsuzakiense]
MTRIPRWTVAGAEPGAGLAWHEETVPAQLAGAVRDRAAAEGLDVGRLLLAAHLKVLRELTAERSLVTRYRTDATRHCTATLPDGAWRGIVAAIETAGGDAETEVELDLRALGGAPLADDGPDPATVLSLAYVPDGEAYTLFVAYRRDCLTEDFAARVAGYHLAALRLLAEDLDADHTAQSLLSDEESAFQLGPQLNGPDRPLPAELFVELFEAHAQRRPEAIAATHNDTRWTYRDLDDKANHIAHALLDRGLRDEDVVAVVMERNLDWLAAALAVFKAGGVYLPVRPDFPPGRIATQLRRSDCRFAVTEPGSDAVLHAATADRDCSIVVAQETYGDDRRGNPGVPIRPEQPAYIYFTSGSTGEPKGAMCEHAGMLNHLFMKVDDMALGAGDVVTQTASQCFDISLWQLMAPLLVGGGTHIVDTDAQLDVTRFIDLLAAGGVQVIQIVPAYLDVMLSHLERDRRALGDLRSVSVTGEALKLGLVQRWFALYPGIALVNAYGATEVSDDTMHAVLDRVPDRDLAIVSVGRSLRNVNTYILDEQQRLVPLGAPGEIAFSGVCVGRGYVNDPERTRQAFTTDAYRPGTRLYRTGDFGRWLPEGTIEFLGRRDEQVKIRGFRIEIGEIENRLLQMPGVREAAVVIDGQSDQTKNLVAFFTGPDALQPADLRDFLAAALPEYMVPAYFHRLDALPLTENGKTNKKHLVGLAGTYAKDGAAYVPPATDTERRLATAWAEVLNVLVGRIGRGDDFFRLGGTSLAAVRLVVKLDRLISLRQLVAHPVLRDLAAAIDGAGTPAGPSMSGLLQPLCTPSGTAAATLVCFPYAGGNAVNFQILARELAGSGIAVAAVELPGHDVARADEPLAGVEDVARRVVDELGSRVTGPVLLWGHCAGAAYALAVARRLERAERPPARVYLGALLLDEPGALRAEIAELSALSNPDLTARLHQDSAYIELDLLKSERAELVGRAYRHDVCSTNQYLIEAQTAPAVARLRTPVEVFVAADDPTTAGFQERYDDWQRLAETVSLHNLPEGGHYFIRSRPADVAVLVAATGLGVSAGHAA